MSDWPFVGRDAELARIRAAVADAGIDAMLIAGDAGLGKTRLARQALSGLGPRVEWVTGTSALASIPFGAVAHLIPAEVPPSAPPLELFRAVAGRFRGSRAVLGADDVHLLDDASAAVVADLATRRLAFVLMTARAGEPAADAVTAVWNSPRTRHLRLSPLRRAAVDQLIDLHWSRPSKDPDQRQREVAVGSPLDGLDRKRLHDAALGNPLALRELLHGGVPGGLTDLVVGRLRGLTPDTRAVVEIVACGEPLDLWLVEGLADPAAIAAAEVSRLVVVERDGARTRTRLDHPMYGEVVRATMPRSRVRQISRELAARLLGTAMRRRDDPLRAALWQVEGGQVSRADVVRLGAAQAIGRADLGLAERLARAARDAAPGAEADRLLAEILEYRGKSAEAAALTSAPGAGSVRWAVTRAETLYWGGGDLAGAERVLDAADGAPAAEATRSWILFFDGQCARALATAHQVWQDGRAGPEALVWAAAGGIASSGFLGRAGESAAWYERGRQAADAHRESMPWAVMEIEVSRCLADIALGHLRGAAARAAEGYEVAVASGVPMMVSGWGLYGGLVAAVRGHLDRAEALLREALAGFTENDTFRFIRLCEALLAWVAALRGDAAGRASETTGGPNRIFDPWIGLWRAWAALAGGRLREAIAGAAAAAEQARTAGLPTVEATIRYDLVRMGEAGGASVRRLGELAALVETPYAATLHLAAAGLAAGDGTALAEAGAQFGRLGHDLLGAEAGNAAAREFRGSGHRARATLALEQARGFRASCAGARTPLLDPGDGSALLTPREREVMMLAPTHTSRQIAQRLGLAVATVNNNLARTYAKLGVSGRDDLRKLLRD